MELVMETHSKTAPEASSDNIGLTKVVVEETVFKMLESMEQELIASSEKELFKAIDPNFMDLQLPMKNEELSDCRVRMYIDESDNTGLFHVVAHRQADNSLVYTDAVKLRTITA